MMFALGFIAGVLVCVFGAILIAISDLHWDSSEKGLKQSIKEMVLPKKSGAIYEAPLDIDIARQEIIDQNNDEGRPTKVEDLI